MTWGLSLDTSSMTFRGTSKVLVGIGIGVLGTLAATALLDDSRPANPVDGGKSPGNAHALATAVNGAPKYLSGVESGEEFREEVGSEPPLEQGAGSSSEQPREIDSIENAPPITHEEGFRLSLERRLETFRSATTISEKADAATLMSGVSIAAILDASGSYEQLHEGEAVTVTPRNETEQVFQINTRLYRFHEDK